MLRLLKYSFLILLFTVVSGVFGQKTIVKGRVYDKSDGNPLPFVNIAFKNSKIGTVSDLNGFYSISTYYATDSLSVSFVGYKPLTIKVKKDVSQTINFGLEVGEVGLEEVVIKYKGNPADIIFERIIENKPANNREKFSAYEYELYNKVEFDLNNISEDLRDKRIMKNFQFIFDYVDSTDEKPYLPMFMTETISKYAFNKDPKKRKEVIIASKVSGLPDNNISQLLGDMYQNINVYENQIEILGRELISPISNSGQRFYNYYLTDSAFIDNKWCYRLDFKPKRAQTPVFKGHFWVNDTTYAIKRITASFPEKINMNYIRDLYLVQEFDQVDKENWMMTRDYLLVDFNISDRNMGVYGRKTSTYRDFVINQPRDDDFFSGVENVTVAEGSRDKDESYWQTNRHIPLSENEAEIYEMVDSLKELPAFKSLVDIVNLVVTGYKEVGDKIEIGPYVRLYSYNPIEEHRFRVGIRTSKDWSERVLLYGHLAYGTGDQRFKYEAGGDFLLSEKPRQIFGGSFKNDLEQLGQSRNAFSEDNFLSSILRRTPQDKLTNVLEYKLYFEREWFHGFSTRVIGNLRELTALGQLEYKRIAEGPPTLTVVDQGYIKDFRITVYNRWAHQENFILSGLRRISLGSYWPIIDLLYTKGFSGVDGSLYDYHILKFAIKDKWRMGALGTLDWRFEAGKYFGAFAYPLLELHPGNESYFYDNQAYNLMNYFEFASDEYVSLYATHHFNGLFFNRVPLLRKLKWREVVTVRSAWGKMDRPKHTEVLIIPDNMYSLESKPYLEASVGVENIFTLLRVDFLYRMTHLDHPNIATFGIRMRIEIGF